MEITYFSYLSFSPRMFGSIKFESEDRNCASDDKRSVLEQPCYNKDFEFSSTVSTQRLYLTYTYHLHPPYSFFRQLVQC